MRPIGVNSEFSRGSNSDILQDGSLDYPDEVLGSFDFVVASVHSRFRLDAKRQTESNYSSGLKSRSRRFWAT